MQPSNSFDLNKLTTALNNINLVSDGDSVEQDGAKNFGMAQSFFNYESFWKFHVVPATERPNSINSRKSASRETHQIGQNSYSIFTDMYEAEVAVNKIKVGDFGGLNFKNVLDIINYTGDAIQKFKNLQDAIEIDLKNKLGFQSLSICPVQIIKDKWLAERKIVISYRNTQTHNGKVAIFIRPNSQGDVAYMMDPYEVSNYFYDDRKGNKSDLTWKETYDLFNTNPEKFLLIEDACLSLIGATYNWLNQGYYFAKNTLDTLIQQQSYIALWGLSQAEYNDIIDHYTSSKPIIPIKTTSSGSFYMPGSGSGTYQV
ncbi:hypothetical protein GCM10027085_62300 [Spirosoma aerophilum]